MADSGKMPPPIRLGRLLRWQLPNRPDWIASGCKPFRRTTPLKRDAGRGLKPRRRRLRRFYLCEKELYGHFERWKRRVSRQWKKTAAAADFAPLPPGEYVAHITGGELYASKTKGTPGYKLSFKVIEGEFAGRRFWHDLWLTPAALPMAKRDLAKLGVTNSDNWKGRYRKAFVAASSWLAQGRRRQ